MSSMESELKSCEMREDLLKDWESQIRCWRQITSQIYTSSTSTNEWMTSSSKLRTRSIQTTIRTMKTHIRDSWKIFKNWCETIKCTIQTLTSIWVRSSRLRLMRCWVSISKMVFLNFIKWNQVQSGIRCLRLIFFLVLLLRLIHKTNLGLEKQVWCHLSYQRIHQRACLKILVVLNLKVGQFQPSSI